MARSTRRPPQKPTPIDSNVILDEQPPDIQADIPPEFQPSGAQAASQSPPKPPAKLPTFYETMNKVAKADWGPRANIYLYRVEPVIDRTRSGEFKFICSYAEPINDDRVMADYGSGRYKLMLNYRKAGADQGDLLDSVYIDILNMKFPPKIPLGEWVDDPKNKKWAWAKEAGAAPAASPAAAAIDPLAHLNTFMDIQDRIEERLKPAEPAASTAVDPWAAAEKILNMRSDNPMVEILKEQMKVSAAAAEAERDRAFKAAEAAREREFKLQEKLLESKTATAAEKPKTLMEQLTDFKALKELFTSSNGDAAPHVGRTTYLDVARDLGSKFFESDLASGVGQWLGSLAQRNVSNPAPTNMNGTAPPQVQQAAPDQFQAFIRDVLNPSLLRHYLQEFSGADFAGWLYDGYPDRLIQLQSFTHPMMPGLKGAPAIIQAYKRTDSMWPALSSRGEQAFTDFVNQFCEWKPDSAEPAVDAEVIETESDESEEEPERI